MTEYLLKIFIDYKNLISNGVIICDKKYISKNTIIIRIDLINKLHN